MLACYFYCVDLEYCENLVIEQLLLCTIVYQLGKLRGDGPNMDRSRVGGLCPYKVLLIQKWIVLVHLLNLQTPYRGKWGKTD